MQSDIGQKMECAIKSGYGKIIHIYHRLVGSSDVPTLGDWNCVFVVCNEGMIMYYTGGMIEWSSA